MSLLEILLVIISALMLVKIAILFINPNILRGMVEKLPWKAVHWFSILAAILLFYMVQKSVSHLMIMAIFFASALLIDSFIALWPKEMVRLSNTMLKDIRRAWLPLIVTALFAVWVIYSIL